MGTLPGGKPVSVAQINVNDLSRAGQRRGAVFPPDRPRRGREAFSLIEIVGVLAVVTIAMLALTPALLKQIDLAAKGSETAALQTIMSGLHDYVCANRRIPAATTFAQDMAAQLGWLLSAVNSNARGNPRCYLVDPALLIGNPAQTLPYVQGINGALPTVSPRVMLVSSLGAALPASVTSGAATNAATFDQVWSSADDAPPTGWTGGGNWADIRIQRLNLDPLFVPVILNNDSPTVGHYSIDNTNNHVALPSIPFSPYLIVGTKLGLHATDGTLQTLLVLQDFPLLTNSFPYFLCPSFVYEKGVWRGKLFMSTSGQKHNGVDLQAACDIFESGPRNVYHTGSLDKRNVTMDMWYYMSNYIVWASSGFASGSKGAVSASQSTLASDLTTYCDKKASDY